VLAWAIRNPSRKGVHSLLIETCATPRARCVQHMPPTTPQPMLSISPAQLFSSGSTNTPQIQPTSHSLPQRAPRSQSCYSLQVGTRALKHPAPELESNNATSHKRCSSRRVTLAMPTHQEEGLGTVTQLHHPCRYKADWHQGHQAALMQTACRNS